MLVTLYSGHIQGGQPVSEGTAPAILDRACMLVYEGTFQSMDGEVKITPDHIEALVSNHNKRIDTLSALAAGGDIALKDYPPIQLDHSTSARDTVGRLMGPLRSDVAQVDGKTVRALFGTVRFLGRENVEKASDGRFTNVSIGADLEAGSLRELSVTPFPAAAKASLLAKGSTMPMPDEMKKRCKKYLTEEKKMSDDEADKKLAALTDEDSKKLSEEVDEDDKKKLAAEDEKKEKLAAEEKEKEKLAAEDAEDKKKLAAAKPKIAKLMAEANETVRLANLEAKRADVTIRLSKYRASAQISPAEQTKLSAMKLAEADDKALALVWQVLDAREPVIHVGAIGSIKAVDLAATGGVMKGARLAQMEKEMLGNMPFTRSVLKAAGDEDINTEPQPAAIVHDDTPVDTSGLQAQLSALQAQNVKMAQLMTALAETLA